MLFDTFVFDLRQVLRSLRRRPAYVAASVGTLALVLAANATLFATINATIFHPIPFRSGERTLQIYTLPPDVKDKSGRNPLHAIDLVRFRESAHTLEDVSGFTLEDRAITGSAEPEVVRTMPANATLFNLLSDTPVLGRVFTTDEEEHSARVVVLTHGLWQRRFGSDRNVLGKTLDLDGTPFTVIGVMPPSFPPAGLTSGIAVPLGITRTAPAQSNTRTYLLTLARLADRATMADAAAELKTLMVEIGRESPKTNLGWTAGVTTYREWQFGDLRAPLFALLAAMVLLMLIAAANIAGLTLAHVSARKGEIALRRAIGASGAAIARMIVFEVGLLNFAGAAIGIVLATRLLPVLLAIDPAATQSLGQVEIDWRVTAYAFLSAIIAAAIASLAPAMNAAGGSLTAEAFGSTRTHGHRTSGRWRSALLIAQTSLCLVLLVCGGLLLRALSNSNRIQPGFDPAHVLTAQLRLPADRYATPDARANVIDQMLDRLRAIPGVIEASQTLNRFTPGFSFVTLFDLDDSPTPDGSSRSAQFRRVSPGYFRAMRIPELRGRTFTREDSTTSLLTCVLSKRFVDTFWPRRDPIGRQVKRSGKAYTVIGVVGDAADVNLLQAPEPTIYLSWAQTSTTVSPIGLVVRTDGDPSRLARAVREAVLSVDHALPLDRIQPLETFLDDSLAPQRFRATLLGVLAIIGLLLGAIGVAGVTARSIAERRGEMGVRLALGCDQAKLWRGAVMGQLRLVIAGVVVGSVLSYGAGRLLGTLLPEIGALDPVATALGAGVLLVTSVVAAAIPASRVLRLDPVEVLRN